MSTPSLFQRSTVAIVVWMAAAGLADAGTTDLATAPLATSTTTLVKPNIFYVLDDSGSMDWNYLPDYVGSYTGTPQLFYNSKFNGVYYDPSVTYTPPVHYDGSSYKSMTAANTSNWTRVPNDGYGVQSTSTTNLTSGYAFYYTFTPGEYCTDPHLISCNAQTSASTSYPYAAYVRFCTNSSLTTCRATYIDTAPSGGSTYTYVRYPGQSISRRSSVPGSYTMVTISSSTTSYPKASTRTDCAGSTCTYSEEMTNFANWWAYYQTRMQMTKTAASLAFINLDSTYRLGYMSINNNTGSDFLDVDDNTTGSGGHKQSWYNKFTSATPNNSTPLRIALATAGQYYAGKKTKINGQTAHDPMQYACQRNYTILSTDGYWNESSTPTQVNGSTTIGDPDGTDSTTGTIESRPYLDSANTPNTLADVAEYYYVTDLRSSTFGNQNNASGADVSDNSYSTGRQRMYTSTVGLGASGYMLYMDGYDTATSGDFYDIAKGTTASPTNAAAGICSWQFSGACTWPKPVSNTQTTIDDLWHAAVNGRGTYYSAKNPTDLQSALTNFLNSVNTQTSTAAAPTASNVNLSATGSNYVFGTAFCSGKWFGDLMRFSVNASTGALSSTPDWAEAGGGGDCTSSTATTPVTPLLDNQDWTKRAIYTFDSSKATTTNLLPFQWSSLPSSIQAYFKVSAISSLSQMCVTGTYCLPTASQVDSSTAGTTTGVGGINLVNYLRGDRENEGTANTAYYYQRKHVLGDIVDSQPAYVQAPNKSYTDTGYTSFVTSNASRQGMVYVGANDGMLHAFNADTGAESWAYIPSMLLPNLYKLADKNYASKHVFLVDGAVTTADAYFGGSWHTILVGGLGDGGRGYYALDITNPASPSVLWEFTYDTSKGSAYTTDADLGYSYGTPQVTKLSDGTWVVLVTSGYNNVSPGSGHGILYVLNAQTGAIIQKLDTGVGSSTGTVTPGCSTAPCPSGLAKFATWVSNATVNNTAAQVYAGDLFGNLWRFDISKLTGTGGTATIQLLATLADAGGKPQPITAKPELGLVNGNHVVYVGTGSYLGVSDISTTQVQTIYAIKDPLTTSSTAIYSNPRNLACNGTLKTNCFVQQTLVDTTNSDGSVTRTATSTVTYPTNLSTQYGWFDDLPESGERDNTNPLLAFGTLIVATNVPNTAGACSTGGSSYINFLDFATGLQVTGVSYAGGLLSKSALASNVTLMMLDSSSGGGGGGGGGGSTTSSGPTFTTAPGAPPDCGPNGLMANIGLSNAQTAQGCTPNNASGSTLHRLSWRELISQ